MGDRFDNFPGSADLHQNYIAVHETIGAGTSICQNRGNTAAGRKVENPVEVADGDRWRQSARGPARSHNHELYEPLPAAIATG